MEQAPIRVGLVVDEAGAGRVLRSPRRLRVADVALFYGERSGGIRTYLEAKAEFARRTGLFDHHLVVPGPSQTDGRSADRRHEHRSIRLAASNGYRIPLGSAELTATLRAISPDVVLLHDPYWAPRLACRTAHELGAMVVAVHHSSAALHAAGLPGPQEVYRRALRRWYRHAYLEVDAIMSVIDPGPDASRPGSLSLRLGLDPVFRPRPGVARDDHVLYVGRLSREKGVRELIDAAALAREPWPLVVLGTGPTGDALRQHAERLGLSERVRFAAFLSDRSALAREYARARCVVLPGEHETFGLVALEAAACGAPVVTADRTPAAKLLGAMVETFQPGDPHALAAAIGRARASRPDPAVARAIARRNSWDAALAAELSDLETLVRR